MTGSASGDDVDMPDVEGGEEEDPEDDVELRQPPADSRDLD